ncbi:MAG: hypothetical protein NTV86_16855 [Planctomycetota bacterium]|nr:hypothetical protein [Planctomycetota bacterium]
MQGQTTEPAPAAAPTAAAPAPVVLADPPATAPASQPAATEFSDQEIGLLGSITDGDDHLLTDPLGVLLKHAARLRDDAKAEKISANSLWVVAPGELREKLKPVAFEGWYAGRCEERRLHGDESWPEGTFYLMHVMSTTDKGAPILLVALTKAPPASLRTGTKVYFTGYFYKSALLPLDKDPTKRQVNPVLVAKAVEGVELESAIGRTPFSTWGLIAAIVVLLGLGVYFQMRVKAHKQQAAMQERVQSVTRQPEEDADFDIDPDLQQEVERFEAEQEAAHHPKDNV